MDFVEWQIIAFVDQRLEIITGAVVFSRSEFFPTPAGPPVKTARLMLMFRTFAQPVRDKGGTWLLIGWFTVCSLGVPIPSGHAVESETATFTDVTTSDATVSVQASRTLEPSGSGGGCCAVKPELTDHRCGCSLKKQQSGTCCCSKKKVKFATSCCSNKLASRGQRKSSEEPNDATGHDRIISVCGCAEEVGGLLFFLQPFELSEQTIGPHVPDECEPVIVSDVLFDSHFVMPESPPPEVV